MYVQIFIQMPLGQRWFKLSMQVLDLGELKILIKVHWGGTHTVVHLCTQINQINCHRGT